MHPPFLRPHVGQVIAMPSETNSSDGPDLEAGRAQRFRPAPLITAARLHHRPADPVRAQPRCQLGLAFRRARRRQAPPCRANAGVDFALCNIKAEVHALTSNTSPMSRCDFVWFLPDLNRMLGAAPPEGIAASRVTPRQGKGRPPRSALLIPVSNPPSRRRVRLPPERRLCRGEAGDRDAEGRA